MPYKKVTGMYVVLIANRIDHNITAVNSVELLTLLFMGDQLTVLTVEQARNVKSHVNATSICGCSRRSEASNM